MRNAQRKALWLVAALAVAFLAGCRGSLLNPIRCKTVYGPWDSTVVVTPAGDTVGWARSRWWERTCD